MTNLEFHGHDARLSLIFSSGSNFFHLCSSSKQKTATEGFKDTMILDINLRIPYGIC